MMHLDMVAVTMWHWIRHLCYNALTLGKSLAQTACHRTVDDLNQMVRVAFFSFHGCAVGSPAIALRDGHLAYWEGEHVDIGTSPACISPPRCAPWPWALLVLDTCKVTAYTTIACTG